ncbi:MAG: hypothetical protein AB7I18_04005 [Candidatus Berkiella sp.]
MNLGPAKKKRIAGTLQSAAVSALSISQLIASVKLVSPNSLIGLGVQALSLAGVYVGTRWSVDNLRVTFGTEDVKPVLVDTSPKELPVPQEAVDPAVAPAPLPITPARALAAGPRTRGLTKRMLDQVLEAEQVLIPEQDRTPITTVNPTSFELEPINAYPKDQIYITECNHGLVINEYARHLISYSRFDNPYTRQPLTRTDIDNLLKNKVIKDTVSLYGIPTQTVPAKRNRQSTDHDREHQESVRRAVRRVG